MKQRKRIVPMKFRAKAVFSLLLTALLLTGCGTAVASDTPEVLPSIDEVPGEAVSVEVKNAGASPENAADSSVTSPDKVDIIRDENEDVLTQQGPAYIDSSDKGEFSYTPDYDKEFFDDDLFIGDSISTGYSGYGIIDEKNVFAKIGLNPLTALDTEVTTTNGDILLEDELRLTQPKRAYIMLGSNGIDWLACSNMRDAIGDIIDAAAAASPDTQIVCLSIPPVTKEYDEANEELDVMDKINTYNELLEQLCGDKGITYIDITTMLEDNEGYFVYYYAESDGMHFKPTAYKMLLSKIQYTLS